MVRASLSPWLVDFVSAEVEQVVNWKKSLSLNIKPDPESRLEDDGSNFRSSTTAFPEKCSLQLIEILSISEHPTVILSDGQTRVKARLSAETVGILEDDGDFEFSLDTLNDVFQPKKITVISTPFGPSDGFIQLHIDDIEYERHLRRAEGHPLPIQEIGKIQQLLNEINQIRCAELPSANNSDDTIIKQEKLAAGDAQQEPATQEPIAAPVTVSVPRSSPPAPVNDTPSDQNAFQTQGNARRRQHGASLARDGFEVETGLNLQRPLQAASNDSPITNAGTNTLANDAGRAKLLGLLGGKKGGKRPREPSPPITQRPLVSETPVKMPARTLTVPQTVNRPTYSGGLPSSAAPTSAQPPPKETQGSLHSSGRPRVPYGRRKIPADQKNLLGRKDSWLPSLPGQTFPTPSVPMKVLEKWNTANRNATSKARTAQNIDNVGESEPMDISSESSDSEEEFSHSQWPPSSPAPEELPPDSSFDNVVHGGSQEDLEVAAPRAMMRPNITAQRRQPDSPSADYRSLAHRRPREFPSQRPAPWSPATRGDSWRPDPRRYSRDELSPPRRPGSRSSQHQEYRVRNRSTTQSFPDGAGSRPGSAQSNHLRSQPYPQWERQAPFSTASENKRSNGPAGGMSPPLHAQATMASSTPTGPRRSSGPYSISESQQIRAGLPPKPSFMPEPQSQATDSTKRSWENRSMVGRRRTGEYGSSPNVPATTPDLSRYAYSPVNGTPTGGKADQPTFSSATPQHSARVPNTQVSPAEQHSPAQNHNDQSTSGQAPSRQTHPDEDYRAKRREYMQHHKRRDWVLQTFRPDPSGSHTIQMILSAYKAHHNPKSGKKNEAVDPANFWRAVREAFPDDELPHKLKYSPKVVLEMNAGANNQMANGGPTIDGPVCARTVDGPDEGKGKGQKEEAKEERPPGKWARSREGEVGQRQSNRLRARGGFEVSVDRRRAADGHEMATPSRERMGHAPKAGDQAREQETPGETRPRDAAAPQEAGPCGSRTNGVPTERERVGVGQFARQWSRIQPGGAFAEPPSQETQRDRRRVDVLQWDI